MRSCSKFLPACLAALLPLWKKIAAALVIGNILLSCPVSAQERFPAPQPETVPGHFLVKFKPSATRQACKTSMAALGLQESARFKSTSWTLMTQSPPDPQNKVLPQLSANPLVAAVEPDYFRYMDQPVNDPHFMQQWHHRNTGQTGSGTPSDPQLAGFPGADIDSVAAWLVSAETGPALVADIDSGADLHHPDLAQALWVNPGEASGNGMDDDGNGFIDDVHGFDFVGPDVNQPKSDGDPMDDEGHGTATMGCMAAVANNGAGVAGSGLPLRVMVLKAGDKTGRLSVSAIISAMDYAWRMGATAINASYGGADFSFAEFETIQGIAPMIVVAAAGNRAANLDQASSFPACYELSNIISVGAGDRLDQPAYFSNFGKFNVDLFAPGLGVLTTICAYDPTPDEESSWDRYAPRYDDNGDGVPEYGYAAGTSFSAPLVTGVVGMMRAQWPDMSPEAVRQKLNDTVERLPWLQDLAVSGGRLSAGGALNPSIRLDRLEPEKIFIQPATSSLKHFTLTGLRLPANAAIHFQPAGPEVLEITVTDSRSFAMTAVIAAMTTPGPRDLVLSASGQQDATLAQALWVLPRPHGFQQYPMASIPDNTPFGQELSLTVPDELTARFVEVEFDAVHPAPSDLAITLRAPDGTEVVLQQPNTGSPLPNMNARYPFGTRPAQPLSVLFNHSARGVWKLLVSDQVVGLTGMVTRWSLAIYDFDRPGESEPEATYTPSVTPVPTETMTPPVEAVLVTFDEPIMRAGMRLEDEYQYLGLRFSPDSAAYLAPDNFFQYYSISAPYRIATFDQFYGHVGSVTMEVVDPRTGAPAVTGYFEATADRNPYAWGRLTALDLTGRVIATVLPDGPSRPMVIAAPGIAQVRFEPGLHQSNKVGFDNVRFIPPGPTLPIGSTPTPGYDWTITPTRPPVTTTPLPKETPVVVWGNIPYELKLPFQFPFAGKAYETVYIYAGGFITLEYDPTVFSRGWVDLVFSPVPVISAHGGWLYPEKAGRVTVENACAEVQINFAEVPGSSQGHYPNTFTLALLSDGRFRFDWKDLRSSPSFVGYGIGPSGQRDDQYLDLSAQHGRIGDGAKTAIYEVFAGIAPDISHRSCEFAPVAVTPAPTLPAPPTATPTLTPAVPRPSPYPWETPLPLEEDDNSVWVAMPGGFPFGNKIYGEFRISPNGYVTFGTNGGAGIMDQPVIDSAEKLRARQDPTIILLGQDMDLAVGGLVALSTTESGLRLRFAQVREHAFGERVNDCTLTLFNQGVFSWRYGDLDTQWGVVGYTLGAGWEPVWRAVDMVSPAIVGPVNTGTETVVWEEFSETHPLDLAGRTVLFRPAQPGTPLPTWTSTATPSISPTPTRIPDDQLPELFDINRNGMVDLDDLLYFERAWHAQYTPGP